ncbi:hypothetical protein [Sunxiuqinia sp. sy24]|uniref:hypothetical protein n=1 Tax=Sunxiuqinia sp. sy24 TaxID=3461495 RepID=UPI004045563F
MSDQVGLVERLVKGLVDNEKIGGQVGDQVGLIAIEMIKEADEKSSVAINNTGYEIYGRKTGAGIY